MREAEGLSGCCRLGQATPRTHLVESPPRTKSSVMNSLSWRPFANVPRQLRAVDS